uniref:A-kinase anchor protein 17A-like n=1 Tax=Panthera onca TaxID=9690 RepID=UPI002953CEB3|nr:A-kinase anchor protein 17A-like [Panthera onca]
MRQTQTRLSPGGPRTARTLAPTPALTAAVCVCVCFRPQRPAMAAATIVHDTSEAVELCPPYGLYLKPITKMTISVALPQLKQPGKSISNWEVMERLKAMVQHHQFSTLRISKSTMDFIRFEGEVENRSLVKAFLACLDGKTIKLSGFSDILKVRAAEFRIDFPTRHDWDSFFRDAKDMNETLPGERPDTIHLEGLPCKWFALKDSGSEKPSEEVLVKVFEKFGAIRNVDIPMLDPYREEMTGRNFHTFSFGGHLNFEAYVQYREYVGFIQAMSALRGMKLMYKGEDGKAVACNIKVSARPASPPPPGPVSRPRARTHARTHAAGSPAGRPHARPAQVQAKPAATRTRPWTQSHPDADVRAFPCGGRGDRRRPSPPPRTGVGLAGLLDDPGAACPCELWSSSLAEADAPWRPRSERAVGSRRHAARPPVVTGGRHR